MPSSPTEAAIAEAHLQGGRLDDDALFYLRSRGIPELTARELLIDAFTGEIVEMVDQVEVRDHLRSVLPELGSHSGGTQ